MQRVTAFSVAAIAASASWNLEDLEWVNQLVNFQELSNRVLKRCRRCSFEEPESAMPQM
jgi:hypothetical protein